MQRSAPDTPIDMAPLQRVIEMFALMAAKILDGALDRQALAGLKKINVQIERLTREMRALALHNMRAAALARLRTDVDFRERVRAELGGFHVIKAWREKLRAASFPIQIELRQKLDSHIILPRPLGQGVLGRPKGSRNKAAKRLCAPIPLMPHDLDSRPRRAQAPKLDAPANEARDPFSNSQRISQRERSAWQWHEPGQDYFPPELLRPKRPPPPPRVRCP